MSTIAKLLVSLGLDARDYTGGVSGVTGATASMVDKIQGSTSAIDSLTTKLDQQTKELSVLQQELDKTTAKYGEGSIQAQRKQLAIDKLTNSIKETTQGLAEEAKKLEDEAEKLKHSGSSFINFDEIASGALRHVGEIAVDTSLKVAGALVDQGKQTLMAAGQYETMRNVFEVTSDASETQMKRMGVLAMQLGDDISLPGASAKSAAEAMIELNRRGIDIENSFSGARGVLELSAAANLSVAESATIGANVMDIYGVKGDGLIKVNDQLVNTFKATGVSVQAQAAALEKIGPIADQLNIPLDQTQAMIGMLGKKGIEGSEAGTQLRGVFMSLMNPSTEAKGALADLGIAVYDMGGKMKTPIQLIEDFSKVQVGSQVTMRMTSDELEKIGDKAAKTRDEIGKLTEKNADLADQMVEQAAKLPKAIEAYNTKRIQAEEDYHDRLTALAANADQKREDLAGALTGKLTEIETSHQDKILKLADDAATKRADLETNLGQKLTDLATGYQSKVADLEQGHQQKLVDLTDQATQKRQDLEESFGQKIADLATGYQQKIANLEQGHQQKLIDLTDQAASKRADIEEGYGEKLADMATNYQRKLEDIAGSFQQKQADIADKYHDGLEKLETAHEGRMASIRQKGTDATLSYQQDQINRAQDLADTLAGIERNTANKQQDITENYQDTQQDQTETHQEKLTDLATDYQRKIADLQADLNGDLTDKQKAAIEERIRDAKTAYDRATTDEATRYSRQQAQAQQNYDRQLEQLQQQHDREAVEVQRKADEEQQQADERYVAQQVALEEQLRAEQMTYDASRDQAKIAYQNQLRDLADQQAQAQAQAQTAYDRQQSDAKTAHGRQLSDLQEALQGQIKTENDAYTQRQIAAQQTYTQQQADAQTAYDRQLADMQTALQRQIDAEHQAYTQRQAAAQQDYTQQQATAQTAYDRQIADLNDALSKQTAAEQATYERSRAQAQSAYDTQLAAVQTNLDRQTSEVDAAYTKQERRAKEAFDTSFTELADSVAKRRGELQKEMDGNTIAIDKAHTLLSGYDHTLATHGEHVVTLTQAMRDEALANIFGRENLAAANIVLASGTEQYQKLTEKIDKTGTAQALAAATTKGLDGAIAGFTNTIETLRLELGELGLPVATQAMKDFTQYIIDHKEDIKGFARDTIIPLAQKLLDLADGFVKAGDKTAYLKQKIDENTQPILDALVGLIVKAGKVLGENGPAIGSAFIDGLASGIKGSLTAKTPTVIQDILGWFQGLFQGVYTAIGPIGQSLLNTTLNFLTYGMWDHIRNFWGIHSPSTKMMEIAKNLLDGLWGGFSSWGDMGGKVYTWFDTNIVHRMQSLLNVFPDIGRNIVDSLWTGLNNAWGAFASRFTDLWNQIPQGIRDALQMHSPSRILVGLGSQAAQSVVMGAERMMGAVTDAGQNLGNALVGGVGPLALDATVSGSGVGSEVNGNVQSNVGPGAGNGIVWTGNLIVEGSVTTDAQLVKKFRDGLKELARMNGRDPSIF